MKSRSHICLGGELLPTWLIVVFGMFLFTTGNGQAQGTVFSYQGRLNDGGNPANGWYDFRFLLYDGVESNANQVSISLTNLDIGVTNGLFAVPLDFGSVFNGSNYWLDIGVRTNGGNAFVELAPRQPVTQVPNALFAANAANLTGALSLSQMPAGVVTNGTNVNLSGNFYGNGGGLSNLNSTALTGVINPQNLNSPGGSFGTTYNYSFSDVSTSYWYQTNFVLNTWSPTFHTDIYGPLGYITNYVYFGGGNWADRNGAAGVTNSTYDNAHQWLEFQECSTNVAFVLKGDSGAWQILIDGVPESTQHVNETAANTSGTWMYIYQFSDRRTRHICLYGQFDFEGICCATNEGAAYSLVKTRPKTCVLVGDSYIDGPGSAGKYFFFNTKNVNVVSDATGGTGYIAPGSGSPATNYFNRLGNVVSVNPDYVIVTGGINDPLTNGSDNLSYPPDWTLAKAVTNYLMTLTNLAPRAKIFVQGPWFNATPNSTITQADTVVSNACAMMGIPYSSAIYPTPLIYGTYQNPPSGNAAVLISSSNSHPNEAGSMFLGNCLYSSVVNAYPEFDQAGGAATPLLPAGIKTINAPVNGDALRYTNGSFYWAP